MHSKPPVWRPQTLAAEVLVYLGIPALLVVGLGIIGTILVTLVGLNDASSHGRRLRRRMRLLAPDTTKGEAWLADRRVVDVPDEVRPALGEAFREIARREHASIAAFDHVALELLAVGAPPDLVTAAHEDALDEVRHASLCFALARDIDGRDDGPAPFPAARRPSFGMPTRTLALAKIAVEALVDGVLNEGHSARLLARLAGTCEVEAVRDVLVTTDADEARHAAHSLAIIRWCIAEGGEPVACILRGALRRLPRRMTAPAPDAAKSGAWEKWGVHGERMDEGAWNDTRARALQTMHAILAS